MKKTLLLFITMLLLSMSLIAQSRAYTLKGGLTIGTQRWDNSFQRDPLFAYHGIAGIESAPEDDRFALFAQVGYHVKGSAIRTFATSAQTTSGQLINVPARTTPFKFKNISLTVGGKQKYDFKAQSKVYYMFGVRGDYTASTQLRPDFLNDQNDPFFLSYALIYPFDDFVRKWNYGVTFGGGMEIPLSEFISGILEFTINPDFKRQYDQPRIENIINPNPNTTNNSVLRERQIRNITFELTVGFRFLHKIEYID